MFFADWLMETKPQDENILDFRAAMRITGQPVTFSARIWLPSYPISDSSPASAISACG